MKKGDVQNQKILGKRLNEDDDAVSNLYYNNGYVFSRSEPTEINIDGDSIDLEMRVTEGPQAYLCILYTSYHRNTTLNKLFAKEDSC